MVRPTRTLFWISGGLGASLFLTLLGWWSVRHTRGRQPAPKLAGSPGKVDPSAQAMDTALREARTKRLNGDFYGFYLALSRATGYLPEDSARASLLEQLEKRSQEVGYRGMRPTDDMMDGDWRDVDRARARWEKETLE